MSPAKGLKTLRGLKKNILECVDTAVSTYIEGEEKSFVCCLGDFSKDSWQKRRAEWLITAGTTRN